VVSATTGRVALFSIHPRYAEAILDGTKQVEFRRQGLPDDVTHIVVYATAPTQQVVGWFKIADIERLKPSRAWSRYRGVGGIDKPAFSAYYDGTDAAYVIHIESPTAFATPFSLTDIDEGLRPPQSYLYLDADRVHLALQLGQPPRRTPFARILDTVSEQVGKVLIPALK
jgi:predicted transcriptional regulator